MTDRGRWQRGWRGAVLLVAGVFIGATLITPAVAHVGGTLNHLWGAPNHIRDRVRAFGDPRWINATEAAGGDLSGTYADLQIAADAVGAAEIATSAVGAAEIATDAVGSSEIAANAVGASEIVDGSVGAAEIADGSVGAAEIGAAAVGASEVNLVLGTPVTSGILAGNSEGNGSAITTNATASCAAGQVIIGITVDWNPDPAADEELYIVESKRTSSTAWRIWGANDTDTDRTFTLTPLCLG
jgi:hypothetical protein